MLKKMVSGHIFLISKAEATVRWIMGGGQDTPEPGVAKFSFPAQSMPDHTGIWTRLPALLLRKS